MYTWVLIEQVYTEHLWRIYHYACVEHIYIYRWIRNDLFHNSIEETNVKISKIDKVHNAGIVPYNAYVTYAANLVRRKNPLDAYTRAVYGADNRRVCLQYL